MASNSAGQTSTATFHNASAALKKFPADVPAGLRFRYLPGNQVLHEPRGTMAQRLLCIAYPEE